MSLLDWIFPIFCAVCGKATRRPVCPACEPSLGWNHGPSCRKCGAPALHPVLDCLECRGKPMDFDGAQALGYHRGALRELVVSMKHPSQAHLAGYFAEKIASLLSGALPDRIVPVPVPRWEHALAGYSSASELAFRLAKRIGRPCDADLLRKVRSTRKQKELQLRERLSNLRSAFAVSPRRRTTGERILLVDDVLTTGATLSACSVALRDSGAARIECAIVTRG